MSESLQEYLARAEHDALSHKTWSEAVHSEPCTECARKDEEIAALKRRIDEMHDRISQQNRAIDRLNHEATIRIGQKTLHKLG